MVFENGDMSGMEEGLRPTRRYAPVESAPASGRWLALDTNEMLRIEEHNYLIRRLLPALDGHNRRIPCLKDSRRNCKTVYIKERVSLMNLLVKQSTRTTNCGNGSLWSHG